MVNLKTGHYYSLDLVGTEILDLLRNKTYSEVIEELKRHFPENFEEITHDMNEFLEDLVSEGIIEQADSSSGNQP